MIEAYLSQPLTAAEVEAIIDKTLAALAAGGSKPTIRQMGAVMKPVTAKVAGRFDGKLASELVRKRLS